MATNEPEIVILHTRIALSELARLTGAFFENMVNIRPAQGNRSMLIADTLIRERVREITFELIGEGEPLP